MSKFDPDKEEAVINAAKEGGKAILDGLGKAGLMFTKRMAEGAFNAQMAQQDEPETSNKIRAAGSELGRAFLKGAIEGGSKALSGIITGVNEFSKEMSQQGKNIDEDSEDELPE